jgi:hypothetical protein
MIVSDTTGRNDRLVSVLAVDWGGIRENARVTAEGHVTYRSVLRNREFSALLLSQTLSVIGDQLARLAIAFVVFERTDSALAASGTYAASYLTYLLGGPVLSALSDRYSRVAVMVACDLLRAPLVLALCVSGLPIWTFFAAVVAVGALGPPFDSARSGMLPDILTGERYTVGNAILNFFVQGGNVLGFVAGGALVALVSARGALALDAATFLVSAGVVLACVHDRPVAQERGARGSLFHDTWAGLNLVARDRHLRALLGYALLGSAAIIAPEGLAVPVAHELGGAAIAAGVLTGTVPAGFLVGSLLVLRTDPDRRERLLPRLALLSCVPLLATPSATHVWQVALLWFVAGAGGTVNLIASVGFIQACPRDFRSRAFGVAVTALNAVQGAVLLLAGGLASVVTARQSVAIVAVLTLGAIGVTAKRSRVHNQSPAQEKRDLVRYGSQ